MGALTTETAWEDADFRDWAKQHFLDNETGTDEYRESQPEKGLGMISDLFTVLRVGNRDPRQPVLNRTFSQDVEIETFALDLTQKWLAEMHRGFSLGDDYDKGWFVYAGADELRPILELFFDLMWLQRRHPYYEDLDDDLLMQYDEEIHMEGS